MINQELARQWLIELKNPENKKTVGHLKTTEGECCLGLYCRAVAKIIPEVIQGHKFFKFNGQKDWLPRETAKELNITNMGNLTKVGIDLLVSKIGLVKDNRYLSDLTDWNDDVFTDDKDFTNMAKIIELLVNHERDTGEECFKPCV